MGTYDTQGGGARHDPAFDAMPDPLGEEIYNEVEAELAYQAKRWGFDVDDARNEPNDWVAYMAHHSTRWFAGGFTPYSSDVVDTFRKQMVKTAAIAFAAIASLDRQRAATGRAFYEETGQ